MVVVEEFKPINHPIEPPEDDRPMKHPLPSSPVINVSRHYCVLHNHEDRDLES